jgi:signal transduction histidine kinase
VSRRVEGPDAELLRSAARRVAWQISAACAIVVIIVALLALSITEVRHGRPPPGPRPEVRDDDLDDLLRETLVIAAVIGIAIAGVVGFLVARRAVAPLGEALALQRRFVADAGHELRTPLTVLHTRAQLVARRMGTDDPSRPAVDQLVKDSRVLGEIVDEMLESAALGADPHRGETLDIAEVAADVADGMQALAGEAGVALVLTSAGDRQVRGSRTALRRAITALVDNALSHTPRGGRVEVAANAGGDPVVVAVTDSGTGLGGENAERLTERFARGDDAPAGVGGGRRFGLGLSLVREVAAAHGGTLSLTEPPEGGVRAVIALPALQV